jgi:hypothetical protein
VIWLMAFWNSPVGEIIRKSFFDLFDPYRNPSNRFEKVGIMLGSSPSSSCSSLINLVSSNLADIGKINDNHISTS